MLLLCRCTVTVSGGRYLVVDMVSAHSDRVHDKLPPMVITGSTVRDVVRIVLCSKVMAKLMGRHQICLLFRHKQTRYIKF